MIPPISVLTHCTCCNTAFLKILVNQIREPGVTKLNLLNKKLAKLGCQFLTCVMNINLNVLKLTSTEQLLFKIEIVAYPHVSCWNVIQSYVCIIKGKVRHNAVENVII